MLEVLFDSATAGSMRLNKVAGNTEDSSIQDGGFLAQYIEDMESAHDGPVFWVTGSPDDVCCLDFMLGVGRLDEDVTSAYRRRLPDCLNGYMSRHHVDESSIEPPDLRAGGNADWVKLHVRVAAGEAIRIWYGLTPDSLCGFLHLCSVLSDYEGDVSCVRFPDDATCGLRHSLAVDWNVLEPSQFGAYLWCERTLSRETRSLYAREWKTLVSQNSSLRSVIDGRVVSVPEDFYDFMIMASTPKGDCMERDLIEAILARYPVGIPVAWFAKRIQAWIDAGRLVVVKDSDRPFRRCLRKAVVSKQGGF